jgi:hypothetical protein
MSRNRLPNRRAAQQQQTYEHGGVVGMLLESAVCFAIRRSIFGPIRVALQIWLCGEVEE